MAAALIKAIKMDLTLKLGIGITEEEEINNDQPAAEEVAAHDVVNNQEIQQVPEEPEVAHQVIRPTPRVIAPFPQPPPPLFGGSTSAFRIPQRFGSGAFDAFRVGQNRGMTSDVNRSFYLGHSYRRENMISPPAAEMRQYCVINISNRTAKTGGSRRRKDPSEQRPKPKADDNRTCTNFNCRTKDTPMWRRGPLGTKTLCNSCGIKYRKLKLKEEQPQQNSGTASSSTA